MLDRFGAIAVWKRFEIGEREGGWQQYSCRFSMHAVHGVHAVLKSGSGFKLLCLCHVLFVLHVHFSLGMA